MGVTKLFWGSKNAAALHQAASVWYLLVQKCQVTLQNTIPMAFSRCAPKTTCPWLCYGTFHIMLWLSVYMSASSHWTTIRSWKSRTILSILINGTQVHTQCMFFKQKHEQFFKRGHRVGPCKLFVSRRWMGGLNLFFCIQQQEMH